MLSSVGVFATFRYTSGTAYTKCPAETGTRASSPATSAPASSRALFGARLPASSSWTCKFTKGFGLGGLDITGYLDARNVLNFKNILNVFAGPTTCVNNARERASRTSPPTARASRTKRAQRDALLADGAIDLRFGGARSAAGCGNWVSTRATILTAPNCVYLIRAEERYGNGDHIFTIAEQRRPQMRCTTTGARAFTTLPMPPGRCASGIEVNF